MDQAQADLEREELIAREVNAQKKKVSYLRNTKGMS